jgi:hypothetical protein
MTEPLHNPNIDEKINPPEVPDAAPEIPNVPDVKHVPDMDVPNPEAPERANPDVHEGAKDDQVSDRVGPGAGYDQEPEKTKDKGGVS